MSVNTAQVFEKLCKRKSLKCLGVHSLRHLNASLQIASGIDIKTVQSVLGHSTPTTTLNIYSHSFTSTQTQALEMVSAVSGIMIFVNKPPNGI